MYCKKCGCRINYGEQRCSDCGTEVGVIEYCGGFWGLVGENNKKIEQFEKEKAENYRHSIDVPNQNNVTGEPGTKSVRVSKNEIKIRNKYKKTVKMLLVIILLLLIIGMVQTIRFSVSARKYKQLQDDYNGLQQNYEQLQDNYNVLQQSYRQLDSKFERFDALFRSIKKRNQMSDDE